LVLKCQYQLLGRKKQEVQYEGEQEQEQLQFLIRWV
jgi:hypothetical protein